MSRRALAIFGLASSAALAAGYALPWAAGGSGGAWRLTAAVRITAGLAVAAFFAGLSASAADAHPRSGGLAWVVAAAGMAWGLAWTLSGLWIQVSLSAVSPWAAAAQVLGLETLHVLTPSLTLAALVGVAATGRGLFPMSFIRLTWGLAAVRLVLALWDWAGPGGLSVGLMDIGILWVAAAGAQLLRADLRASRERAA